LSMDKDRREHLITALNTALREASGQGVMYSQAVAHRLGINSTDLECLDHIVLRGPLTAGALAEATGLTTGAITGVIDRLERVGFARRKRDPEDRRKVSVSADPVVFERVAPLFEPMQRAALAAVAPYTDKELALLLDFFTRVRETSLVAMAELRDAVPKTERRPRNRSRR
jgi:DNA-binding MarR family transcriptional regulator